MAASASFAAAASTSVGIGVSRGESSSMAYSLNFLQKYEPWIDNGIFEISPTAELGGHAWVDNKSDVDTVWGAYLAPGLHLSLYTDSRIRPYLSGSVGGTVNSRDELDDHELGSHVLFRTRGSLGVTFGEDFRHRVQGDFVNHSNWGLSNTNDGYSTYGLSYGYSF